MQQKYRFSGFVMLCLAGIAVIVVCNAYLLCCGRCAVADFYRVPPIGWLLILANLVAGIILYTVKRRRVRPTDADACLFCQINLHDSWLYCPRCGREIIH
jgi:hypothetical protein